MSRFVSTAAALLAIGFTSATVEAADPPTSRTLLVKVKFDRESLQGALEKITAQTGVPFEMNAPDLRLEGITGCSAFGCDEPEQPLEHLVRWMFKKDCPDDKIVYTVKTNAEGKNVVHVTTRSAAERRREQIFPEFNIEK
jgi:hypothetical protein